MQKIPLNLATADMVVARDIFKNDSPSGMPICGKGTVLSGSLISRLQQMGVQSLYVQGHPIHQEGDRSLDDQLADLERRFSKTLENRHNQMLLEIYRNHVRTVMGEDGGRAEE